MEEQQADGSLKALLEKACPVVEMKNHAQCYIVEKGVLMRKWVPQWELFLAILFTKLLCLSGCAVWC